MKKRMVPALLLSILLLGSLSASAAVSYDDVPLEHWSAADVAAAAEYGLMQGIGENQFGLGQKLSRAEFVTMLSRMFSWGAATPGTPSFSDCAPGDWFYAAVEGALAHGVVDAGAAFRPKAEITRAEMAVMLVRALGYESLAAQAAALPSPFADVSGNGYITLACDIGLTNGVPDSTGVLRFLPAQTATREEAAAMLVRVYRRYSARIEWLHAFYAFSSFDQIGMTAEMDGVSVGWARMSVHPETGPWLNATTADGNEWTVPAGADAARDYFAQNQTPYNLNVYASVWDKVTLPDGASTTAAAAILSTPAARAQAIAAIVAAAPDYAGITIDFEGMGENLRAPFTAFMQELRAALPSGKTLYVCVPPDEWFGGFDYRALGEVCDKVILMAHDYQWSSIPDYYVGTDKTDCPVTPFYKIYTALRAVTDPETGVQDRGKVALAISIASTGFEVDENNLLRSTVFYNPAPETIIGRLRQSGSVRTYSEEHRNPSLFYSDEAGARYRLWYEDAQSVTDKVLLARMFGVTGISLWRLGRIPSYADPGLHYDVWGALRDLR